MRRWLLALVAVALALAAAYFGARTFAQPPRLARPGAFLFSAEIAKIRQAEDGSTLAIWRERLLSRAREEAASPLPLKEKGNLAVAPMVPRLALAAALTDDAGLREAATAAMRDLTALDSWTSARQRGMCELHTADTALAVALAYHLLRGRLSVRDRKAIANGLATLAIRPYLGDARRKRWNLTNSHNWNGVINGGLLAVSLLLEPEDNERVEDAARGFLPVYFDHFASDGGWDEGASYLWYGLTNPAFAAYLAGKRARPLELPDKVLQAPGWQEEFTSPGGRVPAFGDALWNAVPSSAAGYLALVSDRPAAMRAFARREQSADAIDLLYLADLGELQTKPASPPPTSYASPIGWALARVGDTWLAVRGGVTSSNHAHLDLGSFILEAGGDILLTDPGVPHPYPYEEGYFDAVKRWQHPAVRTSSHSTILVNGVQQTLTARFDTRIDGESVVGQMTQGYGDGLRLWRRKWNLQGDSLVVEDLVELSGSFPVTCIFVAPQAWEQTVRPREWTSGRLNLKLTRGPTPEQAQSAPAVLGRAYPLEIALPASESLELTWEFTWRDK